MGGLITQQPNGLFARISRVVDAPTADNMTREDLTLYLLSTCQATLKGPRSVNDWIKYHVKSFESAATYLSTSNMTETEIREWKHKVHRKRVDDEGIKQLKIYPLYFAAQATGVKQFEIRNNDRNYAVGDLVRLNEWNDSKHSYSGRSLLVQITFITDYEQQEGYIVFGTKSAFI